MLREGFSVVAEHCQTVAHPKSVRSCAVAVFELAELSPLGYEFPVRKIMPQNLLDRE
jgi:hypothetical protein